MFYSATAISDTSENLRIGARVLGFQKSRPAGEVRLAIVYNPDVAGSLEMARTLAGQAEPSLVIDDLRVQPVLLAQSELAGLQNIAGVFSVDGVDKQVLSTAMRRLGVPCLTTDISQVRAGACTVAIQSEPRVNILINMQNARDNGLEFATAFLMMVKEI